MKRTIIALTCMACFVSTQAEAAEPVVDRKKNEVIGLSSGVAVGAIAGGPIGAMIGGVMGILLAEDVSNDAELAHHAEQLAQRETQLVTLNKQYTDMQQQLRTQLVSMDGQVERVMEPVEATVQFRSGSYVVEPHFSKQLDTIAMSLSRNPDMIVELSGYADRRGDETFNQALSEQRVLSVKQYLRRQGVDTKQMRTLTFGETQPVSQEQNLENDFFDRRVVLRVMEGAKTLTVSN